MSVRATPLLDAFNFRQSRAEAAPDQRFGVAEQLILIFACLMPIAVCWYLADVEPLATLSSVEFTQPDVVVLLMVGVAFTYALWKGFYGLPKRLTRALLFFFLATFVSALFARDK